MTVDYNRVIADETSFNEFVAALYEDGSLPEEDYEDMVDLEELDEEDSSRVVDRNHDNNTNNNTGEQPPLPPGLSRDQLTICGVYGLHRDACGTKSSTDSKIRSIWRYWHLYCQSVGRPTIVTDYGLGLYEHRSDSFTVTTNPGSDEYNHATVRAFLNFLLELKGWQVNKTTISTACTFLNCHLRAEFFVRMRNAQSTDARLGSAKVGESEDFRPILKMAKEKYSNAVTARKECVQCDIDNRVTEHECRLVLRMALGQDIVPGGRVQKQNILQRIVFGATFTASAATLRRGEEFYKQKSSAHFTREMKGIGPSPTICHFVVTKHAKHNSVGRIEVTAMTNHVDVLRCSLFWHGLLYLYQLTVDKSLNAALLGDYNLLFDLPTYPTSHSRKNYDGKKYGLMWLAYFKDAQILTDKLTHIWRGQGQRELDEMGVSPPNISRMTGHGSNGDGRNGPTHAQQKSYLNIPPPDSIVGLAGGDPHNPKSHCPAYMTGSFQGILEQIPEVKQVMELAEELRRQKDNCKNRKEMKEKRLSTLSGVVGAILHSIECFIRGVASRPVDPKTRIVQTDQPSIRRLFRYSTTLVEVLSLPVFSSPEFLDLERRIHDAEDRHLGLANDEAEQSRMESRQVAFQQMVVSSLQGLQAQVALLRQTQQGPSVDIPPGFVRAAAYEEHQGQESEGVSSTAPQAQTLLQLPEPVANDSLEKTGGERKRRRALKQRDTFVVELQQGGCTQLAHRQILSDKDNHCVSYTDHLHVYLSNWRESERKFGSSWRTDRSIDAREAGEEGTTKRARQNSRSTYWSTRKPMFVFFEHYFAAGYNPLDIAELGEAVYSLAKNPEKPNKKPPIKRVRQVFTAKLTEMGVEWKTMGGKEIPLIQKDEAIDSLIVAQLQRRAVASTGESVANVPTIVGQTQRQPQQANTFAQAFSDSDLQEIVDEAIRDG